MKIKSLILTAIAVLCAFAAQAQTFVVNDLYYEVVNADQNQVFIAPRPSGNYTNVASNLPAQVTYQGQTYDVIGIGAGAFVKATFAGNCILPEGYIYIDNSAFEEAECTMLKFSTTVQYVSQTAFFANKINSFSVTIGNPYFKACMIKVTGKNTLFCLSNPEQNAILAAPGQGITNHGGSVSVPSEITRIEPCAFAELTQLTAITLPATMEYVGRNAFQACTNLTRVTINNPNTQYGVGVFISCAKINSVTLPAGMPELPNHFLSGAEALKSINLPNGMVRLGNSCLMNTGLTSINLPETVELVDSSALQWISTITSINLKNVKRINSQAFGNMTALTSVTGGDSVQYIGNAAFIRCNALTAMPSFPNVKVFDGTVFYNCTGLRDVTIPASLEQCMINPFVNCTALNEIKVEEGSTHFAELDSCLYEIVDGQPYALVSMPTARANTRLVLQPGTQFVAQQALRYAPVTEFIATDGLRIIESSAFSSTTQLQNIELPSTVEAIYSGFPNSSALTSVTVMATVPPETAAFADAAYENATLYVPMSSVEAYRNAEIWMNFQNIVGIEEPVTVNRGDVNGDGTIDPADIASLINYLLNGETINLDNADCNLDGCVDPADIASLINYLLGGNVWPE